MSIQVGYIPRDISDFIYEVLCRDNTFPWFYQEQTSFYNGTAEVLQLDGYEEHPYFAHTIVTDNQIKSNAYDIVFDKGALDALMSDDTDMCKENALKMI